MSKRMQFDSVASDLAGRIRLARELSISTCEERIEGIPVAVRHGFRFIPPEELPDGGLVFETAPYVRDGDSWVAMARKTNRHDIMEHADIEIDAASPLGEGDLVLFDSRGVPLFPDPSLTAVTTEIILRTPVFEDTYRQKITIDTHTGRILVRSIYQ